MTTHTSVKSQRNGDWADVEAAVRCLRMGGVIVIPTDTVYGLAASLDHPAAIERIFTIKGRAADKALPVLVSRVELLDRFGRDVSRTARALARRFWPGPLTIVVHASDVVPSVVLRGGTTLGLRMPDDALALEIIEAAGGALAVTSANRSGEPECRSAEEVRQRLGADVDAIVDGGPSPQDRPSSVVDATGSDLRILRHGALDPETIGAALEADP